MKARLASKYYVLLDTSDGDMYAWTENKQLAELFIATRKKGHFKMKTMNVPNDEYEQWKYSVFRKDYAGLHLALNPLGRTKEDTIMFPTTYSEDYQIGEFCDKMHDMLIDLPVKLVEFPLTDEMHEAVEYLASVIKNKEVTIAYDSFYVFMHLFGDTVL